ncbi:MAG TPA: hypothetical protein VN653_10950 [Anaerolineales bacterium]|nr:hypothetical protein [Anaerolineales bacterium]
MSETSDRDGGPYRVSPLRTTKGHFYIERWDYSFPPTRGDVNYVDERDAQAQVNILNEVAKIAHLSGQRTAEARVQELEGMVSALRQWVQDDLPCPVCVREGESDECWMCHGSNENPHAKKLLDETTAAAKEHDARIAREARREGMAEAYRELSPVIQMAEAGSEVASKIEGDTTKLSWQRLLQADENGWADAVRKVSAAIRSLPLPAETQEEQIV